MDEEDDIHNLVDDPEDAPDVMMKDGKDPNREGEESDKTEEMPIVLCKMCYESKKYPKEEGHQEGQEEGVK